MARRSENWSRLEVRAVIRFLWAKNVSASDIQPNRGKFMVVKVPRRFRTIEMARRSENWSRLEVRAVIRFLWAKNVSASDIQPNRGNLW
ncbi:hypothetical protein CEXT_111891 [Caerostris extrusa]|uniref:Type II toxin-antitoxin system HicA family toxin n=1 Tax=Caerostris extrusa TaxID=172846 RepID=A0AAV4MAU3_CAEEX|nr:hypothetical protein CEXT_111891 [Caerostris extrusa]